MKSTIAILIVLFAGEKIIYINFIVTSIYKLFLMFKYNYTDLSLSNCYISVSHARKFVLRPTNPPPTEPIASDVDCPDSLCKWKPVGSLFRLSEDKPNYFVTCTNGGSVCRRCQDDLGFSTTETQLV